MLTNTVRVFFVFLRILRNVRRIIHGRNVILIPQSREKNPATSKLRSFIEIAVRQVSGSCESPVEVAGCFASFNMTALSMGSQQIKQREHKNPDEIDKVPEQSADLDPIRQVLWVALIKPLAHRQPHVDEHQHAAEHVQTM